MSNILFLDKMQQVIKSYDSDEFIECVQTKEITTNASELMNDTLSLSLPFNEIIKDASYIAVNDTKEQEFSLYRILTAKDEDNSLSFEAINFAVDELDNFIIKDIRPKNRSFSYVINQLLSDSGCDWVLGICEPIKTVSSTFYYTSIREALKSLQELGVEFTFSIEITGNKITKKIINCYNKIGKITNKRFEYGDEVLKIVHQQDRTNIVTALIGRGKGEEVGDGYGRRIEFSDIEWNKSNGKPLDKPKGQNWIEYPEMTEKYGIPSNGKMLPRKTVVVFDDVENAEELLRKTYDQLAYYSRPLVQFKTEILGADDIGNTVSIHRGDRNYHYQTRVFKVTTDFVTGKVQASLGDNLSGSSLQRQVSNAQSNISDIYKNKMTFYDSTEIGKYQDDIMRGAGKNGGSIYLVNGLEAGVSQSREAYEQVFMDGPNISESQYFMIQNNVGISFKKCKKGEWTTIRQVHEGESNTAWTNDGTLNAKFIKAGILSGILVQGAVVKTANPSSKYQVIMDGGNISFEEFKEATGPEDAHGKTLSEFYVTSDSATNKVNGTALVQSPGYIFSINSGNEDRSSSAVVQIPADSTANKKKLNLFGEVNVQGKLFLNGTEITPGGGGSGGDGWNGVYPDIVKTQAEKFAWQAWATLRSLGYSEGASAGILGNINGEAGPSMNPDIDQIGGPAYGAVQFDGSAYPLVGTPTNNGREYFQRLVKASGVTGDYKEMPTQMKVVNWSMTAGQWIGKTPPTNVDGFKAMTNQKTAATVFEINFERPATTHPERSDYAQNWYNLFAGVTIPKNEWRNPMRVPYVVTQEWDQIGWGTGQIHGGIDLAPTGGATPPIYVAKDGKVVQIVPNHEIGGNFVVVDHGGYWTYYGHLANIQVSMGQNVNTDTVVGICGATGLATGVHLHFEVWKGKQWGRINPRDVINF